MKIHLSQSFFYIANMQNKLSTLLIYITLLPLLSYSQVGGKGTYQFLNITSSARQVALGGNVISIKDDDLNFAKWNPALINASMDNMLALNFVNYFADIKYGSISYAYSLDSTSAFASNVTYIDYGKFIKSTNGEKEGVFSANEISINIGYSMQIDSLWALGTNIKVINSVLDIWNSYGVAFDLGTTYYIPKMNMMLAMVIRNMGVQLKSYSGLQKEKLPMNIQLGVSKRLDHLPLTWTISLENLQQWNISYSNPSFSTTGSNGEKTKEKISFIQNTMRHIVIGAELSPHKNIDVRFGYNFRRAAEMKIYNYKYFSGFSFGLGLKIKRIRVAYGMAIYNPAGSSNNFSLITSI